MWTIIGGVLLLQVGVAIGLGLGALLRGMKRQHPVSPAPIVIAHSLSTYEASVVSQTLRNPSVRASLVRN